MKPLKKNFLKIQFDSGLRSRLFLVLLVIFLIGVTIWISGPLPQRDSEGMIITPQATITSSLNAAPGKKTADILETTPTSGVILAGLGVVTIILAGTFFSIKSQK